MAEGVNVIRVLVAAPYGVRSVLVTPQKLSALAADLDGLDAPVYVARAEVMNRTVGFNIHRGAVAVADRPLPLSPADVIDRATRVAVVEAMTDQENLGQLFRNAAALGIEGVVLCPRSCDPLYRRTVRVSMGQVLRVPHARLIEWPHGLDALRAAGFAFLALTPAAEADDLDHVDRAALERIAFMVGAEGSGLTPEALDYADGRVRIPMARGVDSLNVATAAAIAFHHFRPRAPTQ